MKKKSLPLIFSLAHNYSFASTNNDNANTKPLHDHHDDHGLVTILETYMIYLFCSWTFFFPCAAWIIFRSAAL